MGLGIGLTLVLAILSALLGTGRVAIAEELPLEGVRVVGWVKCADVDEEWLHVKEILEGAGARVTAETATEDPEELITLLDEAQVLVIPEQEIDVPECWEEALERAGRSLAPAFIQFLERGGRIISLDYADGGNDLLRGAGLTTAGDDSGLDIYGVRVIAPEDPLMQQPYVIPEQFDAPNGTDDYLNLDPDAEVLAVAVESGEPVVFRLKRHGSEIIFLGFDYYEFNEATEELLVNAAYPHFRWCEDFESIELHSNESITGGIRAGEITGLEEQQYCINVFNETRILAIALRGAGNLDMHIRSGKPVQVSGNAVIADFSLVSPDGNEYIIISKTQLRPGPYFIAVENQEATDQEFSLAVVTIPTIYEEPYPAAGTVEPPLLEPLLRYLRTERGQLSLTQYKVKVPEGAESLTIKLEGLEGKDVDLHIRYGEPVEIEDGRVVADLSSISSTGEEAVVISGEFLKPGAYYIAVEGLEPPQEFKITVTIDYRGGHQTAALAPGMI